ncbi:MAG: hypothetical protein ACP5O2_00215 [Bacteroidales bacterium]
MQVLPISYKYLRKIITLFCRPWLLIVWIGALALSCDGQTGAGENLRKICLLPNQLRESSGLVVAGPNLFWSHNDANNTAQLFAFDTLGNLCRTLSIAGYANIDWEDLTTDEDGNIYIADLGNNNNTRTDLRILRISDPDNIAGSVVSPEIIELSYADQTAFPPPSAEKNFDVEAIVWREGYLYLFTKDRSSPFAGLCKMYKVPAIPGIYQLEPQATLFLGNNAENDRVTSAAYNRHTGVLYLLTHNRLLGFTDYPSDHFFEGHITTWYFNPLPGQNEAIDFWGADKILMTEEGNSGASGWLYEFRFPSSAGLGPKPQKEELVLWTLPTTGQLFFLPVPEKIQRCEIIGMDGKIRESFPDPAGRVDISNLSSGIYILRLVGAMGKTLGQARFWIN